MFHFRTGSIERWTRTIPKNHHSWSILGLAFLCRRWLPHDKHRHAGNEDQCWRVPSVPRFFMAPIFFVLPCWSVGFLTYPVAQWVASVFPFSREGFPFKVNQPTKKMPFSSHGCWAWRFYSTLLRAADSSHGPCVGSPLKLPLLPFA